MSLRMNKPQMPTSNNKPSEHQSDLKMKEHKMVDTIKARQDHIQFLENFISEITAKIEELTGGRELEKEIVALEYRIEVLMKEGDRFKPKIDELRKNLKELKAEYEKIKPVLEELFAERAHYRRVQTEL